MKLVNELMYVADHEWLGPELDQILIVANPKLQEYHLRFLLNLLK